MYLRSFAALAVLILAGCGLVQRAIPTENGGVARTIRSCNRGMQY
jgi:hypothetical protein